MSIGPASWEVLTIGIVIPVLLVVFLVLRWRRLRFLGRTTGLITAQAAAICAIGLLINAGSDLVTTWQAMAGSSAGMQVSAIRTRAAELPPLDAVTGSAWARTADQVTADRASASGSQVATISIHGAQTGYQLPAKVYLPGAYFADPSRTFPVLELLTGYPGSILSWTQAMGLQAELNARIADGSVPPVIAVMPTQNPVANRDSECVDATSGAHTKAATYLGSDVPQYIAQHYRAATGRANWVVGGYSTGGFGAADVGLHYNDQFGSIIFLSGYVRPILDSTTGPLFRHRHDGAAYDVTAMLGQHHLPVSIYLITAKDNKRDVRQADLLASHIPPTDLVSFETTSTGGHSFPVWRIGFDHAIRWIAGIHSQSPTLGRPTS
ncbi:alpha/beta hydrolase [Cumulibacter manganitolerans]|uniref:alpha/beta hydrolase n=1 Tax=Cumulibacter manganitolerans TaxID=1884992 RepID=UPI001294AAF9|nr:alpha/beta hydrolase-fold protein [Cumulibacter manganitolerans]